jgi:polyisoprenoid-binding protein YceI
MLQPAQLFFACFLAFISFSSCKNDPKNQVGNQAPKRDTIQVVAVPKEGAATFIITAGTVNWVGKKSVGDLHQGTINVEKGELLVNQNSLINGTITLDMNSLAVTDIKDAGERRDLESHLKDADFFEADKYPKAVFSITEVLPSNNPAFNWLIAGELTMKGKSNPVNIPVKMTIAGDKLRAESPNFVINRTQWGVNFRSGILGTVKDKMIDDNVMLTLILEAKKR